MEANFAFEYLLKEGHFCEEDQTVYEDFIDELIRKYLFDENMSSFYEEANINLECPETDQWQGQAIFPILNDHQDFMVPELLLAENIDVFSDKYDDVAPEEIFSILEEIITEDENKTEGHSTISATKDAVTKNKTTTTDTPIVKGTSYKKKRKRTRKDAKEENVKGFSRQLSPVKSKIPPRNKKE